MQWMVETLRHYPEIAIFLALALGFVIGPIKLGKFSLGNVTGVLLMGVLIGQLEITISSDVKSVFFLMFLFAVGYGVGPQFFRGLKSDGLPQVLFACLVCVSVLVSAFVAAKIAGYNAGQAAGLLSGAATISAVLGVASDSINNLGLPPDEAKKMIDAMPVAYAVTYLFGTAAGRVYWYNPPSATHTAGSQFSVEGLSQLPRVEIFYAHANMGRDFIDHAVRLGVKGVVIAGVGDGNMTQVAVDGLQDAVKKGVAVVRSSRTGSGITDRNVELNDDKLGFIASMELNAQKARILLMLGLIKSSDAGELQKLFTTY